MLVWVSAGFSTAPNIWIAKKNLLHAPRRLSLHSAVPIVKIIAGQQSALFNVGDDRAVLLDCTINPAPIFLHNK